MDHPKYGDKQLPTPIEEKFMKTNSDDKSLGFEAETFNWDEEEVKNSPDKINLGQYEENYEDDFEVVKSNDSTPRKKSIKSGSKKSDDKKKPKQGVADFTAEEEDIIDNYELPNEEEKTISREQQVKEINDLIEIATNLCLN